MAFSSEDKAVLLAVKGVGLLAPTLKRGPHGAIDGIPAKAGQPNQGCTQALGQKRSGRGHITQHQDWLSLGQQPGGLSFDLPWKPLLS